MNYSSKLKNDMKGKGVMPFNVCKFVCVNTCRYSCTAKDAAKHPRIQKNTSSNKK
ncbi:hypothetical protein HRF01_14270 [Enterococcus faecalis]|nr:hypothetical protein [Enterococcus faecalis]